MCQYSSRCDVGTHRPGTICRYGAARAGGGALVVGLALVGAVKAGALDLPLIDRPLSGLTTTTTTATVTRVIDGDTIIASAEDGTDLGRVRILGIDAPELSDEQCHAGAARDAAERVLDGKTVQLVSDPKNDDRDRYDRLLRYVDVVDDGGQTSDAGRTLLRAGHARTYVRAATHTRHDSYRYAANRAKAAGRGLWGHC